MKRIAILGGASPIGRRVVTSLRRDETVESVVALERPGAGDAPVATDVITLPWTSDHRSLVDYFRKEAIDTVVDCDLVADRRGDELRPSGADVLSAMYIGTAISDERTAIRSWVVVSSSAFYPVESYMPLLQREDHTLLLGKGDRAASIGEAEDYARSLAKRMPHVNVAILRLQELVGREYFGPLASLLSRPLVPQVVGFDPAVQFLHIDDAVDAIAWAAEVELAGLYNVASKGLIRWSEAIRATGHFGLPVLPWSLPPVDLMLESLGLPFVPGPLLQILRFGHAIDTAKLARAGWSARFDQAHCLISLC
jgi:UDP-glucose 4-epimerase